MMRTRIAPYLLTGVLTLASPVLVTCGGGDGVQEEQPGGGDGEDDGGEDDGGEEDEGGDD